MNDNGGRTRDSPMEPHMKRVSFAWQISLGNILSLCGVVVASMIFVFDIRDRVSRVEERVESVTRMVDVRVSDVSRAVSRETEYQTAVISAMQAQLSRIEAKLDNKADKPR